MRLKTFRAFSLSEALDAVQQDLGPTAAILHTRTFRQGGFLGLGGRDVVEVIASETTDEVGDSAAFQNLAREYAVALAPTLLAPAETLGVNGFQFDLQFSVTSINADQPHWQLGIEDTSPPDAFVVSRIGVRKASPRASRSG